MTAQTTDTGLLAGTWTLDPAHTTIGFTARHLMSKVRGTFNEFDGRITTTTNPLESTIEVTIKASSISTNNEQRDAHLRSADFFDPEIGGNLTFRSTAIRPDGDGYVITGDLTINGVTRSVDLQAEFLGSDVSPFGMTVLGAEATTTIDRHDYNVNWNMPLDGGRLLVGPKIDITLSVEAVPAE
ncbi:MAG TPA: YceI family protein [Propionibacteriaceae bacterium]|jgi:polyisoprenoid-binding protein YceI|nr:YceI family protein [Propionibacteriaceae bacterium]